LRFSTIAAIFVLFDAEAVLLFAVAGGLRGHATALIEVAAFVAFLALGLAYAWRKGALEWRS
jgi:NADH:ubiquinone oxidoreductase subunit 3 (subunit A)